MSVSLSPVSPLTGSLSDHSRTAVLSMRIFNQDTFWILMPFRIHNTVMYILVVIIPNAVLDIYLKVVRKVNLKTLHHKKKNCNYVWWLILTRHCGVHFIMYINLKSLCSTPEIDIPCQLYFNLRKLKRKNIINLGIGLEPQHFLYWPTLKCWFHTLTILKYGYFCSSWIFKCQRLYKLFLRLSFLKKIKSSFMTNLRCSLICEAFLEFLHLPGMVIDLPLSPQSLLQSSLYIAPFWQSVKILASS